MEFIIVLYPTSRGVVRDDQGVGKTNVILTMNAGNYTFTLAGQPDYEPPSIDVMLTDTSLGSPAVIEFKPIGAAVVPAPTAALDGDALDSLEYLVVLFPGDPRRVNSNGQTIGATNSIVPLRRGDYSITLDGANFTPASIQVTLAGTSPGSPAVISFNSSATP